MQQVTVNASVSLTWTHSRDKGLREREERERDSPRRLRSRLHRGGLLLNPLSCLKFTKVTELLIEERHRSSYFQFIFCTEEVYSKPPWSWNYQTQDWMTESHLMKIWKGWKPRRLGTGPNGTTKPSTSSPAWASAWDSVTSGGSRTCVKATEEVCRDVWGSRCERYLNID